MMRFLLMAALVVGQDAVSPALDVSQPAGELLPFLVARRSHIHVQTAEPAPRRTTTSSRS
jgi:hypothetical protein